MSPQFLSSLCAGAMLALASVSQGQSLPLLFLAISSMFAWATHEESFSFRVKAICFTVGVAFAFLALILLFVHAL